MHAQAVFERSGKPVPAAGMHNASLPRTPLLHAVTHGYVVVLHRPGALTTAASRAIGRLVALAGAENISVLSAPAHQGPAIVALRTGMRLTCAEGGPAQGRAVRRFAGAQFTALR